MIGNGRVRRLLVKDSSFVHSKSEEHKWWMVGFPKSRSRWQIKRETHTSQSFLAARSRTIFGKVLFWKRTELVFQVEAKLSQTWPKKTSAWKRGFILLNARAEVATGNSEVFEGSRGTTVLRFLQLARYYEEFSPFDRLKWLGGIEKYSLVQWNWSPAVSGCTWVTCIRWRQRANSTAPGCIRASLYAL